MKKRILLLLSGLLLIVCAFAQAPGSIDTSYAPGNRTSIHRVHSFDIQSDGKIVVSGNVGTANGSVAIARFDESGKADPGFRSAIDQITRKIRVTYDDKIMILVEGTLIRLLPDGSVDDSFSCQLFDVYDYVCLENGFIALLKYESGGASLRLINPSGAEDAAFIPTGSFSLRNVYKTNDGNLLITSARQGFTTPEIIKINATSGVHDESYEPYIDRLPDVLTVGPDNSIYITTFSQSEFKNKLIKFLPNGEQDFDYTPTLSDPSTPYADAFGKLYIVDRSRLNRLNANGTMDATFSSTAYPGGSADLRADTKNRITYIDMQLYRLDTTGAFDKTFMPEEGRSIYMSVMGAGDKLITLEYESVNLNVNQYKLLRYLANGAVDTTYQQTVTSDFSCYPYLAHPDGRSINVQMGQTSFVFVRVLDNGQVDPGFQPDQKYYLMTVLPDNKYLASFGEAGKFYVVRLNEDGSEDPTFEKTELPNSPEEAKINGDGNVFTITRDDFGYFRLYKLETDGGIDNGFTTPTVSVDDVFFQGTRLIVMVDDANSESYVSRLNADGSLDNSFTTIFTDGGFVNIALAQDGAIITNDGQYISKYNADGIKKQDFQIGEYSEGYALVTPYVLSDNKILVAGSFSMYSKKVRDGRVRLFNDNSVGFEETIAPLDQQWKMYPNPATDKVNLQNNGISDEFVLVKAYTLTGVLKFNKKVKIVGGVASLQVNDWTAGQYVFQLKSSAGTQVMKLIKQ